MSIDTIAKKAYTALDVINGAHFGGIKAINLMEYMGLSTVELYEIMKLLKRNHKATNIYGNILPLQYEGSQYRVAVYNRGVGSELSYLGTEKYTSVDEMTTKLPSIMPEIVAGGINEIELSKRGYQTINVLSSNNKAFLIIRGKNSSDNKRYYSIGDKGSYNLSSLLKSTDRFLSALKLERKQSARIHLTGRKVIIDTQKAKK